MAFLNFYIGRLAYSDASPVQNPKQKNFDFVSSAQGLNVSSPVSITKQVGPGQTVLLDSTARSIGSGLDTSEFDLGFVGSTDTARLRWTGTGPSPAFRVLRAVNYGTVPETTSVQVSRLSPTAVKLSFSGAGVDLSPVFEGDEIYLESSNGSFSSPLNPTSTGQRYTVLSKDTTSVTVRDAGNIAEEMQTLGTDFASVIRFFSSSGVRVGDKIRLSSASGFNSENKSNDFEVLQVSDRDIHFYNPNLIPETVVAGVPTPFSFFDRLINFVAIEASGPIGLSFDGGAEIIQLSEFSPGQAIFASSMRAISIWAVNPTNYTLSVSIQSCTF